MYGRILGALIEAAIKPENETTTAGASIAFGICIVAALVMMMLIQMLPDKAAIEEAQSILFYNEVMQDQKLDSTVSDLTTIKELAQFKLFESFR